MQMRCIFLASARIILHLETRFAKAYHDKAVSARLYALFAFPFIRWLFLPLYFHALSQMCFTKQHCGHIMFACMYVSVHLSTSLNLRIAIVLVAELAGVVCTM